MTIAVIIEVGEGDQVLALVDMNYLPKFDEVLYTAKLQGNLYKGHPVPPRTSLREALAEATKTINEVRKGIQ